MSAPSQVLDGVFAINKPAAISSAQVLRDLQHHFNPSSTFAPWIAQAQADRERESHNQRQKRSRRTRNQKSQVKLGHGGTLDPAATGVLIVGVGSGTKALGSFLECTKEYDAVVLFGAATDTYDGEGKVVKRAGYEHITREAVEEKLAKFRGNIMQQPPIYSALKVAGKAMYEYARAGKDVPKLPERGVTVSKLEMTEWFEGGSHQWKWPAQEAAKEDKDVVEKVLHLGEKVKSPESGNADLKRKRDEDVDGAVKDTEEAKKARTEGEETMSGALPAEDKTSEGEADAAVKDAEKVQETTENPPCPAAAARIRMTVSSGFYVRSLCHDLGIAVGSLGFMASLVRTRQGEFALGQNVVEYSDLAKGEDVWGPQVTDMLAKWSQKDVKGKPVEEQDLGVEGTHDTRRRNTSS